MLPRPDTDPAVIVQGKMRQTPRGWVVTVFFVNTQPEQDRKKDEAWVFQPKMRVLDAAEPPQPIFVQRSDWQHDLTRMDALSREETETLEMLYRHRLEFAVGHGVSVHTTLPEPDAVNATMVETKFMPRSEVEQQTPPTPADDANLTGVVLDMRELAQMPKADLLASLRNLKDAYATWIQRESNKIERTKERLADHKAAAQRAVERCQRAGARITEGIDLMESEPTGRASVSLREPRHVAAACPFYLRAKGAKEGIAGRRACGPAGCAREPDLAFVPARLCAAQPAEHHRFDHPDRSHETDAVADLLWFATGGGKTEAYLGLTAYVLALRRLQKDIEGRAGDHGIAVLMRYTLRLLRYSSSSALLR